MKEIILIVSFVKIGVFILAVIHYYLLCILSYCLLTPVCYLEVNYTSPPFTVSSNVLF